VTLVAVLATLGLVDVLLTIVFLIHTRYTPFAVLVGRASARILALGTARSRRPLSEHLADYQREFDRNITETET
jgi:hypothetical protein